MVLFEIPEFRIHARGLIMVSYGVEEYYIYNPDPGKRDRASLPTESTNNEPLKQNSHSAIAWKNFATLCLIK